MPASNAIRSRAARKCAPDFGMQNLFQPVACPGIGKYYPGRKAPRSTPP